MWPVEGVVERPPPEAGAPLGVGAPLLPTRRDFTGPPEAPTSVRVE